MKQIIQELKFFFTHKIIKPILLEKIFSFFIGSFFIFSFLSICSKLLDFSFFSSGVIFFSSFFIFTLSLLKIEDFWLEVDGKIDDNILLSEDDYNLLKFISANFNKTDKFSFLYQNLTLNISNIKKEDKDFIDKFLYLYKNKNKDNIFYNSYYKLSILQQINSFIKQDFHKIKSELILNQNTDIKTDNLHKPNENYLQMC